MTIQEIVGSRTHGTPLNIPTLLILYLANSSEGNFMPKYAKIPDTGKVSYTKHKNKDY